MSDKYNADQRIARTLEKIKKSIEQKSQIKLESKKNVIINYNIENITISENVEENLIITPETTVFKDRKFINLNWVKKSYQELTFRNCIISNSDFSGSNLDKLRLENCKIFNCNFEKASIQDGFFEDCVF